MNPTDPIVLTVYLLCIAYFLNQIKESFNDEFTIRLLDADADKDSKTARDTEKEGGLKQQLETQSLQDILGISFKFDKRYEFDKLNQLSISISNKSDTQSIYVDWDYSAFTDLDGRSRRVTRLMPGTTLDLFQNQVFSTIAPKTTLKENITAEDLLDRKEGGLPVEIKKPLIDLSKPKDGDAAKRYEKFMGHQIQLVFFLELALRIVGPGQTPGGDRVNVRCKFLLEKLPWQAGLPWNPKK